MKVLMADETEVKLASQVPVQPARIVTLSSIVMQSVDRYLEGIGTESGSNLFELVMDEVRLPLLEAVLKKLRGNQSAAARLMGVSRGTLRKLMKRYDMLD